MDFAQNSTKSLLIYYIFLFQIDNDFTLTILRTCSIMLSVSRSFFLEVLIRYLAKNMALLVQKCWGEFFLSKSVFGYFNATFARRVNKTIGQPSNQRTMPSTLFEQSIFKFYKILIQWQEEEANPKENQRKDKMIIFL